MPQLFYIIDHMTGSTPIQAGLQSPGLTERLQGRNGQASLLECGVCRAAGSACTRHRQGLCQGMLHRLVHLAAVAKTQLDFGGVHIHIDTRWVHVDVQGIHRLALSMQHIFIRTAGRVGQHAVAHIAAIDIGKLVVGTCTRCIGQTGATHHMHAAVHMVDGDGRLHKVVAQHIGQTQIQRLCMRVGTPLRTELAVMPKRKTHIGAGQGVAAQRL